MHSTNTYTDIQLEMIELANGAHRNQQGWTNNTLQCDEDKCIKRI